ncbi:hypothetical protein SO802_013423 [Lithocarpus litseifolius]|uniref:Uncharacterized protein n=1 Tax=Lithocarpus litseifolius TaxID=425828 RepID=A0AAW2D650_9ROSI
MCSPNICEYQGGFWKLKLASWYSSVFETTPACQLQDQRSKTEEACEQQEVLTRTVKHPDAVTYRDKILDDYCDLCLIYATEFEISHLRRNQRSAPSSTSACIQKVRRTIKRETQEAVEGKPCVIKTYLGTEEGKDYSSIECIVAALQTVPDMDDGIFLESCALLEDERKAKMFVAMDVTAQRKWLLKKLRR